jgi:hypothetical protein
MSSCLVISSSIPSSRKRPPFPRTNFEGAKTPLRVLTLRSPNRPSSFASPTAGAPRGALRRQSARTAPSPQPPSGSPATRRHPATPRESQSASPVNSSTRGRWIAERSDRRRGSTRRGQNPHSTLEVAAGWPPLRAPEASGCALLVRQPGHPSRPAGDPARIYYCSVSSLSSPSSRARRAANSATCRSTRRRPSISSWRPSVIWASSPAISTPCAPTV